MRATPTGRLVAAIAVLKIVAGLGVAAIILTSLVRTDIGPRYALMLAHVIVYAAAGLLLVISGRSDRRATALGTVFLLVASVFSDQLVAPLDWRASTTATAVHGLFAVQVDALTPYFLWLFVREFPRLPEDKAPRRFFDAATRLSLVVGVVLLVANVMLFLTALSSEGSPSALRSLSRHGASIYWPAQFALSIIAFATLVWKSRHAALDDRRRVSLLVGALVIGAGPTIVWVFLQAVSATVATVLPLRRIGWLLYPTLLSTPFATAYAVIVTRALDITLVVRRAVQYALARYTVIAAALIPVTLLVASTYRNRNERIAELLSRPSEVLLGLLAVAGLVTLRRRSEALDWIDRRFFREQYDSRQILGQLVDRCRMVQDPGELAEIIRGEVDRALHLEAIAVLFLDRSAGAFVSPDGDVRPLGAESALAQLVGRGLHTVDIDLEHPSPLSRGLPAESLHWLVDGRFRLLVPLHDAHRLTIGILALGEKKSELPFSKEDKALLAAVASAAEMTVAFLGISRHAGAENVVPPHVDANDRAAAECGTCGLVQAAGVAKCVRCGGQTVDCILPRVVAGKFRIDERIGAGGMGVVYRGMDVHLGRLVAIKTLPFLAPDEAVRLRREARAMASVSHPNLALIFGAETWQGRPMLVFEYLAGGTLADRLEDGALSVTEAVELGVALSAVLIAIHNASVLHRDIKPSNIGFTADATPKLLDFGLARIITALGTGESSSVAHGELGPLQDAERGSEAELRGGMTSNSVVRGTFLYMSPEALLGDTPSPGFDLWGLSVALYEAMAGANPLAALGGSGSLAVMNGYVFPDIRSAAPTAPAAVADFFGHALAAEPARRPRTAEQLHEQLRSLRITSAESLSVATPPGVARLR